ncbi:MAG: hypothetical protein ACHQFZ_09285 [Acidimicrobiales bacterium]
MRWGNEIGLEKSLSAIFSEDFDPVSAPMDDPHVVTVLSFGETVGAFVKHGVLDKELLRDVYWFDGMWRQVEPHALKARALEGEPSLYTNFESLVRTAAT